MYTFRIQTILLFVSLTLCSCATMFNPKKTDVTIITNQPSRLVMGQDTISDNSERKLLSVVRDRKPLVVTVYTDSLSKTVSIKSQNSFAYWLNLYPNWHLWTGFIIDTHTKRRFTYPKTVYIDLTTKDSSYLTFMPLEKPYGLYPNLLKITPLKTLGVSSPSIELSYERRTSRSFSTQVMASYLLPNSLLHTGNDFKPGHKGYRLSIEERLYLKKSAFFGPYIAFEFDILQNQFRDIKHFGVADIFQDTTNFVNYPDTFGINKQTYSFNFKLGYQFIYKRLSVDCYAGLGLRHKSVSHFDRMNPADAVEMSMHPNFRYYQNLEGVSWNVSVPLNVKVGWTF